MKKIFLIILFSIIFSATVSANTYIENIFNWKKIKVFEYDINDTWNYILKVWVNSDYNATSLRELLEKNNWVSAINWVFFCPKDYRECGWMDFTKNERYAEWQKYFNEFSTWDRVVFAWDKENKPFLFQSWKINPEDEWKINYWLANHPLILKSGEEKISEYEKLGLVDSKMKVKWTRNFICSTEKKDKIYFGFVYDISLPDLANYLKDFWCFDALNLDAWATTSMIYNGRQIVWPGRNLLDWIIIERKWLDTKEVRNLSKIVKEKINIKIKDYSPEEKIKYLEKLQKNISNYRSKTYDKNSFLYYNSNWKQTWYKIVLNNQKTLEDLYLINYVSIWLNELLVETKKEKKYLENSWELLF